MADPSTKTGAGHPSTAPESAVDLHFLSQPLEMSELDASKGTTIGAGSQSGLLNDVSIPATSPITPTFPAASTMDPVGIENTRPGETSSIAISVDPLPVPEPAHVSSTSEAVPSSTSPPVMSRLDTVAIGPADAPVPAISEAGPVLVITLLLTTGARHPYKIDEKYLTKRNVNVPGVTESGKKDPFSISVYTLKELILREWREEWEAQPSSPSSIRLIFFGRLLDDKTALKECRFNVEGANVVHMTVRPQDIVDEEDASKSKQLARDQRDGEGTAGCRCVIL